MTLSKSVLALGDNELVLEEIEKVITRGVGVVPFVGAGVSFPYGFPLWRDFLLSLADREGIKEAIEKRLDAGEFEEAAEDIETKMTVDRFQLYFTSAFSPDKVEEADLTVGAAAALPQITVGPVITTNFDHVLERAFNKADRPFASEVWGSKIDDVFVKGLHQNRRVLIKLHGDVEDDEDRILTLTEYKQHYGGTDQTKLDPTKPLPRILDRILSARPMLFVGCSLDQDRTVSVLTEVARGFGNTGLVHYAILERPADEAEFKERNGELFGRKIGPIWFPPTKFDVIEDILRHLASMVPRAPDRPGAGDVEEADEVPTNLTHDRKVFIGRETELEELADLIRGDRFVTLYGPPGSGKTELATQVAWRVLADFPDGVYLVPLSDLREARGVPSFVGKKIGLQEQAEGPPTDALVDYLAKRKCLIVLDNCDHLLEACQAIVGELLDRTANVAILATSRQLLDLDGESRRRVGPLSLPDEDATLTVAALERHEATALFLARAKDSDREVEMSEANIASIVRICSKLDGIPLAIEFAAARLDSRSIAQIDQDLEDRFASLRKKAKGKTEHHKTLETAVQWSYDLLTEEQQALLRGVSTFVGGWSAAAANEVIYEGGLPLTEATDRLVELADRSLVVLVRDKETRFSLLETLREYGLRRQAEADESDAMRRRHLDWVLDLAERGRPELVRGGADEWLDTFEHEQPNVKAAMRGALDSGDTELALRLGADYWRFWEIRGYLHEGRRLLGELLDASGPEVSEATLARVHSGAGLLAYRQSDSSAALAHFTQAYDLEIAQDPMNVKRIAECLNDLGIAKQQRGELDEAKADFEKSRELFLDVGEARQAAIAGYNSGNMAYEGGDLQEARRLLEQAVRDFDKEEMLAEIGYPLTALGAVLIHLEEYDEAAEHLERAVKERDERGDRRGLGASLQKLGRLAVARGEASNAVDLLSRSIRLQQEVGDQKGIAMSLESFALHAMETDDPKRTGVLLAAAARILAEKSIPERPVDGPALDVARRFAAEGGHEVKADDALSSKDAILYALEVSESG